MTRSELSAHIFAKKSFLCVGLDSDLDKIPAHLLDEEDPIFAFNKAIIDATLPYCVAYKPNTAFYEALGPSGWESLRKTLAYIPDTHLRIADAKRGDIGNTSARYAKAFFEAMSADALTVAPYMGRDSVLPFLDFPGKWVILLGLTSNVGSQDFQMLADGAGEALYERVLRRSQAWGSPDNLMYVVGATQPAYFERIRAIAPDHFLLVPGIGAQGGDLDAVIRYGRNAAGGLLINASRSIIYASAGRDFAGAAAEEAQRLQQAMSAYF